MKALQAGRIACSPVPEGQKYPSGHLSPVTVSSGDGVLALPYKKLRLREENQRYSRSW